MRKLIGHVLPALLATGVVGPLAWMAMDREPPLILYGGIIEPNEVRRGDSAKVIWQATFSGRDCPGMSQRELIDSKRQLWPYLTRGRQGRFEPLATDPLRGTVYTPPLEIPDGIAVGPATYHVTNFYYCNWLHRVLHWPIIRHSPDIQFEVRP